jgi:hypothetical protein
MKHFLIGLVLTVALATSAEAQIPTTSQIQAATELLRTMDIEKTMNGMAAATADLLTQQNPMFIPYREVLLKWASGFMTWEVFGPRMARLYAESYTESELRELAVFYATPVGKKSVGLLPELTRRGQALGVEVATEHAPELQRMIQQRAAEIARKMP